MKVLYIYIYIHIYEKNVIIGTIVRVSWKMFFGEMHNFTRHLFDFKKRKSLVKHLLIYIVPPPPISLHIGHELCWPISLTQGPIIHCNSIMMDNLLGTWLSMPLIHPIIVGVYWAIMWNLGSCPHWLGRVSCVFLTVMTKVIIRLLTLVKQQLPNILWHYHVENDRHPFILSWMLYGWIQYTLHINFLEISNIPKKNLIF